MDNEELNAIISSALEEEMKDIEANEQEACKTYKSAVKGALVINSRLYPLQMELGKNAENSEEVQDLLNCLEIIKEKLSPEENESFEQLLAFDSLIRRIARDIELISSEEWQGNPWVILRKRARHGANIGFLRDATAEEEETIRAKEFQGKYLIAGSIYVLENPDSTIGQKLMHMLHRLRITAKEESERHKAHEEYRAGRIEELATTAEDVEHLLDGEVIAVAGTFLWTPKNRDDEVEEYLEVEGASNTFRVVDGGENFSNLVGEVVDEHHPAHRALVAALMRMRERLLDSTE